MSLEFLAPSKCEKCGHDQLVHFTMTKELMAYAGKPEARLCAGDDWTTINCGCSGYVPAPSKEA